MIIRAVESVHKTSNSDSSVFKFPDSDSAALMVMGDI
jgi:hypothetical protein